MLPSTATERASESPAEEHAWLVFRLGAHVMCASVLDVEGIIARPATLTALPFVPDYVLGTFLHRDRTATAISPRRKLGVRAGQDSALGPFIVARIRQSLVAFWVDEVKDVIEDRNAAWQPMPEPLDGGLFDKYLIREGELILHTTFAALFDSQGSTEPLGGWAAGESVGSVSVPRADAGQPPQDAAESASLGTPPARTADTAPRPVTQATTEASADTSADSSAPRIAVDAPAERTSAAQPRTNDRFARRRAAAQGDAARRAIRAAASAARPTPVAHAAPAVEEPRRGAAPRIAHAGGVAVLRRSAAGLGVAALLVGAYLLAPNDAPEPRGNVSRPARQAEPRPGALAAGTAGRRARVSPPVAAARDDASHTPSPPGANAAAAPPAITIESETFTMTIERAPRKDTPASSARDDAARPAAPLVRPAAEGTRVHVVVRGDTLWEIARKHLGDPRRYPELVKYSGIRNADLIHPGDVVRIEMRNGRR